MDSSQFDEQWWKTVKNEQKCPLTPERYDSSNEQNTATELESALKMMQTSGKSADPDGLLPLMLKHAGGRFKYTWLQLFNICFTSGDYLWNKDNFVVSTKSFDSIWIDGMLEVTGSWDQGHHVQRHQRFPTKPLRKNRSGTKDSDPFKPKVGISQGIILSPIVFKLYIADVFHGCNGKSFKDADDATSVAKEKTIEQAVGELSKDCEAITCCLRKWRLKISGTETEAVNL